MINEDELFLLRDRNQAECLHRSPSDNADKIVGRSRDDPPSDTYYSSFIRTKPTIRVSLANNHSVSVNSNSFEQIDRTPSCVQQRRYLAV